MPLPTPPFGPLAASGYASGSDLHAPVLAWYSAAARDLPWRRPGTTPWGVLVSEVMLQQTPVRRVEPVWADWLQRWPLPAALAAVPPGEAVRAWGRLGYPRRALRLHEAATVLRDRYDGVVPSAVALLRALPGVGGYTAAAVATFGFGARQAVVDTNVRRVHARAVTGAAAPAPALTRQEVALAEALLPEDAPSAARWAVAVMELGALVCTARSPQCPRCPLADRCRWRLAGSPPAGGAQRPAQPWAGTDRQVRGRLLAVLRDARAPVSEDVLRAAWPADPGKLARCLDSLLVDGLAERLPDGRYALPGSAPR